MIRGYTSIIASWCHWLYHHLCLQYLRWCDRIMTLLSLNTGYRNLHFQHLLSKIDVKSQTSLNMCDVGACSDGSCSRAGRLDSCSYSGSAFFRHYLLFIFRLQISILVFFELGPRHLDSGPPEAIGLI